MFLNGGKPIKTSYKYQTLTIFDRIPNCNYYFWKFMEFLKTESILPFANHCSRKICHRTMKEFLRSYITLLFWTTGLTKFQKKFDLINHTQFNLMYYSRHATGQRVCPWLNIRAKEFVARPSIPYPTILGYPRNS